MNRGGIEEAGELESEIIPENAKCPPTGRHEKEVEK